MDSSVNEKFAKAVNYKPGMYYIQIEYNTEDILSSYACIQDAHWERISDINYPCSKAEDDTLYFESLGVYAYDYINGMAPNIGLEVISVSSGNVGYRSYASDTINNTGYLLPMFCL